jgi:hypothetical protein
MMVLYIVWWDRSYGKVEKTTRCRKWRWNPNLNAKSWKNDFYQRTFKSDPSPKKISKPKVKCIVTSNEKLKNHVNDFQARKNDKRVQKSGKKGQKSL